MVRSVTFEIRWHETQPIYSCSFQSVPPSHLRKVLDYNLGQGEFGPRARELHELPLIYGDEKKLDD